MSSSFHLGNESSSYVAVEVSERQHPHTTDFWDANWVVSTVEVAAGPWRGRYPASLRSEEFATFRDQLTRLYNDTGAGPAKFDSMEPWLRLTVERTDRLGHLTVAGEARVEPFFDQHNTLQFVIELDQSFVPEALRGLAEILEEFPVIGSPDD